MTSSKQKSDAFKAWYAKNRERVLAERKENRARYNKYSRLWYQRNRDKVNAKRREWWGKNAKKLAKKNNDNAKRYYRENSERIKRDRKKFYWDNREKILNAERKNAERKKIYSKKWRRDNRGHLRNYDNKKFNSDIQFRLSKRIRNSIRSNLKKSGVRKNYKTIELIGCSYAFLLHWIESKFKEGMDWNNIHIDHIQPCASFDLTDLKQQKECFHYKNLQPLFPFENLSKGSFYMGTRYFAGANLTP